MSLTNEFKQKYSDYKFIDTSYITTPTNYRRILTLAANTTNHKNIYIINETIGNKNIFDLLKKHTNMSKYVKTIVINKDNYQYLPNIEKLNKNILDNFLGKNTGIISCEICKTSRDNFVACKQCGKSTCHSCIIKMKQSNMDKEIQCPFCKNDMMIEFSIKDNK